MEGTFPCRATPQNCVGHVNSKTEMVTSIRELLHVEYRTLKHEAFGCPIIVMRVVTATRQTFLVQ